MFDLSPALLYPREEAEYSSVPGRMEDLLFGHFAEDPFIGFLETVAETDRWSPSEIFLYEGIVTVTAVDALGGFQVVTALELDAGDALDDVHQLVDGNEFAAAEVDGFKNVAGQDGLSAFQTIINIHEAAGLVAVSPDFNFVFAGELGRNDFAADGGGGFFASAIVGAEGAVNIVETGDAGDEAVVLAEMA